MTDDFLRRHPEVERSYQDAYDKALHGEADCDEDEARIMALAAVLPTILRAHEADLAGRDEPEFLDSVRNLVKVAQSSSTPALHDAIVTLCKIERAAAYLAGRAAGREEAAKVTSDVGMEFDTFKHVNFRDGWRCASDAIVTAIRSLP